MLAYFQKVRPGIAQAVSEILRENAPKLGAVSPMGTELAARLENYAQSGKMIRGILVRLGYELCAEGPCRPLAELLPGLPENAVVEIAPCAASTATGRDNAVRPRIPPTR